MQILIVEDDTDLASAISDYLVLQGAECDFAYTGAAGLSLALEQRFDVIVLDLMLPKLNGFDVCTELRSQGCFTPVVMLTAAGAEADQLQGFQAGVDDYIAKPCSMPLLWARIQAIYRRDNREPEQLNIDTLQINFEERLAKREGQELKLTPTGWRLLEILSRQSPKVVSRLELEEFAWPDGEEVDPGNFNVQVHQLRKAVDKPFDKKLIHTIVGVGLCLKSK